MDALRGEDFNGCMELSTPVTSEEFRDVIGRFATGVTVITANHDGRPYGTTASALTSVSLEPPTLLICMNLESSTGQAIAECSRFAVNILAEHQADLARQFATMDADKFEHVDFRTGDSGAPLLDALATLECRVVDEVVAATHRVFLAEVEQATCGSGPPLAYFRGEFARLAPTAEPRHARLAAKPSRQLR